MNTRPTVNEEREEHKRLRELNAELLEALKLLLAETDALPMGMPVETIGKTVSRAAIKKAG